MLNLEDRNLIRRELPSGATREIAEMACVSQQNVSAWFAGRTNQKKIEDVVFIYLIEERKDRKKKLEAAGLA